MCIERRINALTSRLKGAVLENFAVFDFPSSADLNILIDFDKNELYYYRRVANTLASVVSL